jgi:hypothetical protein
MRTWTLRRWMMSGLGTDLLAVACIVGGAAVTGGATLASFGADHQQVDAACAVEVVESPNVVVALGNGPEHIVVAPRVRVHAAHGCGHAVSEEVQVRVEAARHEMERARERAERARERVERARERVERARVRLERVDERESEELRRQLEAVGAELGTLRLEGFELESLGELIESEIRSEIEDGLREEMELLEKQLERSGDGVGR